MRVVLRAGIRSFFLSTILTSGLLAVPVAASAQTINTSPNLVGPQPSVLDQTWNLTQIRASAAYDRGFTGAGVNVMVGDSGFDTSNAALVNRLLFNEGRSFTVPNGTTYNQFDFTPYNSADNHGSHVAGTIAAEKFSNVAMHGVAYDARIIPFRILPEAGVSYAPGVTDAGINALDNLATRTDTIIYNASYGPDFDKAKDLKVWPVFEGAEAAAALRALQAGKIIVAANGNERGTNPVAGLNPSGLSLLPYLNAAHENTDVYRNLGPVLNGAQYQNQPGQIIAVTALGIGKEAASYSNLCGVTASWCVSAPGGNAPNGPAVYSTVPYDTYDFLQGTSMAAPAVSGALAVLQQANPTYNAQDLSRLLFSTTEDLGAPGIDKVFGHGLIRLDRATDGPTSLAANAVYSVAPNTTDYWSRPLTTSGAFSKTGEGILTISGRTFASGNVSVAAGTLAVDGTLGVASGSALNVTQPATLGGFGVINGNTVVSGTLSPGQMANISDLIAIGSVRAGTSLAGNSVGTLTMNGNVTLGATATTRIDIDGTLIVPGGPGTFDKVIVTGAGNSFVANGALTPVLRSSVGTVSNYTPALGSTFAFVQATNSATAAGSFTSLTQPTDGLAANTRFDVIYAPTTLTLRVTPNSLAQYASANALTPLQQAVANALDTARPAAGVRLTGGLQSLYETLYNFTTPQQYQQPLAQLGGRGQPAVTASSLQAVQGILGTIADRQDTLSLGAEAGQAGTAQAFAMSYAGKNTTSAVSTTASDAFASITPSPLSPYGEWSAWGQGFGRWSRVGDSGDLSGSRSSTGGFTVGADRRFLPDLIAGGAFGFARTSSTSNTNDIRATSDTYAGAAYATWTPGRAVIDARVAVGPSMIQTMRDLAFAQGGTVSGNSNGIGAGATLEAGYLIPTVVAVFKPYGGFTWQGFQRDAYNETQLPFGLSYRSQYLEKVTSVLGVAASRRLVTQNGTTFMPELKLGWGHDFRNTTLITQAALLDVPLTVTAANPGRDAALVGFKMSGWMRENFRVFAAYQGEFRSNATSHQFSGGFRVLW